MGGHHEGDQDLRLGQHGCSKGRRHHSLPSARYGPALPQALSQLLMAHPPVVVMVSAERIRELDLSPLAAVAALSPAELLPLSGQLELRLLWPTPDDDPREMSEIPEVRLWCLRADAEVPWLPLLLERASGTLARHVAMLLPHRFSRNEGLQFAPDALELWISHRLFQLDALSRAAGLDCRQGLGQMAAVLGYELDPGFWAFASRG